MDERAVDLEVVMGRGSCLPAPALPPAQYDEPLCLYRGSQGLDLTSDGSPCCRPLPRAVLPSSLRTLPNTTPNLTCFLNLGYDARSLRKLLHRALRSCCWAFSPVAPHGSGCVFTELSLSCCSSSLLVRGDREGTCAVSFSSMG